MTQADELLKEILDSWNRSGWGYNPTIKERVEKYLDNESSFVEAPVSPKVADILYVVEMEGKDGVNIGRENLLEHLKFMTDNFNKYVGKAELFKYQKLEKIQ